MGANEMILKGNEVNNEKALKEKLVSKRKLIQLPQWGVAWLVLIPALVFLTMFMLYPIINTFLSAFIQNYVYSKGAGSFEAICDGYGCGGSQNQGDRGTVGRQCFHCGTAADGSHGQGIRRTQNLAGQGS